MTLAANTTDDFLSLVCRAKAGDTLAFDQLVRRFQDMAFGYALSLVPDRALAEDIAQEAFLEAYRCLPALRQSAAFPGWLRRLVFKHGDRATRGEGRRRLSSLETVRNEPDQSADVAETVERRQEDRRVREAVGALPDGEREVTSLFYFGGCPTREIAAFLEIPEATVRTRLHRARTRLRKELTPMEMNETTTAKAERPSENTRFARRVLSEIVEEYTRMRRKNPESTDRSLLTEAKQQLDARLAEATPLDRETVRSGEDFLSLIGENDARARLIQRYLTQSLSHSEEAWARFFLVNALSSAGRPEETVAEQEALYQRVISDEFRTDPPRLRREWGYEPVDDPAAETYPVDSLRIWAWYIPEATDQWRKVGRGDDWVSRFYELLSTVPASEANRQHRFHFLRIAMRTLLGLERREEAAEIVQRIAALADEEIEELKAIHWRGHAACLELNVRNGAGDDTTMREAGERAVALLPQYERLLPEGDTNARNRFLVLRDNVASTLSDYGLHDLAIPLMQAQIAAERATPWLYVRLAQSLWATTHDRAETLRLVRQGALRTEQDLWDWIQTRPAFADLIADPDFAAVAHPWTPVD